VCEPGEHGSEAPNYIRVPRDDSTSPPEAVAKPSACTTGLVLDTCKYELAWKVIVPDDRARTLAEEPPLGWAVKEDIARALALRADAAFLDGDGATMPLGVARVPGVDDMLLNAANPEQTVRAMLTRLRNVTKHAFANAGWILGAKVLDMLAVAQDGARSWDSTRLLQHECGLLLGYPFVVSDAAADRIYFSADWSEAWIGVKRRLVTVDVSSDVRFETDETVIRTVMRHDLAVRRPARFVVAKPAA
jgi:HK97 family phage major capsid protein